MLVLEVDAHHDVECRGDGKIVILLRSRHPETGEAQDAAALVLSPHNALYLSEGLKKKATREIAAPTEQRAGGSVLPFEGE